MVIELLSLGANINTQSNVSHYFISSLELWWWVELDPLSPLYIFWTPTSIVEREDLIEHRAGGYSRCMDQYSVYF